MNTREQIDKLNDILVDIRQRIMDNDEYILNNKYNSDSITTVSIKISSNRELEELSNSIANKINKLEKDV